MPVSLLKIDENLLRMTANDGKCRSIDGYFGEKFVPQFTIYQSSISGGKSCANESDMYHGLTGSYRSRRYRSIRDLVSQLWFDDWDEVILSATGICDLTIPSSPNAVTNRECIGSTPSIFEGMERMLRSGIPNAAFHACEALSQLAFRNSRNAARIVNCSNPNMMQSLASFLASSAKGLDGDCIFDLQCAVLRVLNNCAWNSKQACKRIIEEQNFLNDIEEILNNTKNSFEDSTSALATLDTAIGLLNHLSSDENGRQALLKSGIAQRCLLPLVVDSEKKTSGPELYLCAVAGAVEVLIKLMWDSPDPPFLPPKVVLQTIVWTLICSLDGTTWAGITWSALGRVQALARISAVQDLKAPLIELMLVETLARLLSQWNAEQGVLVLEQALLILLNLMELNEARFRTYLAGAHHTLRWLVAGGDEGVSTTARERAGMCIWLLYDWQVGKLELLDRRASQLMGALEDSERARLELETEHAAMRTGLEKVLAATERSHAALAGTCEALLSELHSTRLVFQTERARRQSEAAEADAFSGRVAVVADTLREELQKCLLPNTQDDNKLKELAALVEQLAQDCADDILRRKTVKVHTSECLFTL